jgi:Holliday junction resolvasome RuvABC endonuclease subunit
MIKNILALDTSTVTGVAILRDRMVGFRTIDLKKFNKEPGQLHSVFYKEVDNLISVTEPEIIYKEQGFFASGRGKAAKCLYGFHVIVDMLAYKHGLKVIDIANTTLKKVTTGNGQASKEDMMKVIIDKGYIITNDHEADAVAVLLYAAEQEGIDLN